MKPLLRPCLLLLTLLAGSACQSKPETANGGETSSQSDSPAAADAAASAGGAPDAMSPPTATQPVEERVALLGFIPAMPETDARLVLEKRFGVDSSETHVTTSITFGGVATEMSVSIVDGHLNEVVLRPDYAERSVDASATPFFTEIVSDGAGDPVTCEGGLCRWERDGDRLLLERDEVWPKGASEPEITWRVTLYGGPQLPPAPISPEELKRREDERQLKLEEERKAKEAAGTSP